MAGACAHRLGSRRASVALRSPSGVMGMSNRCVAVNSLFIAKTTLPVHGCLRGRQQSPHDGASREEPSMWTTTHSAGSAVQPHQRNGSAHVPAGTFQALRCCRLFVRSHAAAPTFGSKNSPALSMACMITANFRAKATAARLKPILSRSRRPHVRRLLPAELRVRMTDAAS